MTAWALLIEKSKAPAGSDAFTHLSSLGSGNNAWEMLVDASTANNSTAWTMLNNIKAIARMKKSGMLVNLGRFMR